jgi:ABC-type multidrug transport system fused ATPase/permease subunit
MLIRYIVQIIGSLTIMLALSWKLTLVMLSVVPAIAMGAVRYGKKIKEIRTDFQARTAVRTAACVGRYRRAGVAHTQWLQDALAISSTNAEEAISNIRTVRAFCAEEEMHRQYSEAVRKSLMVGRKMTIAGSVFQAIVFFLAFSAIVLVLWFGGSLVARDYKVHGPFTGGVLTSFMLYTVQIATAFGFMSGLFVSFAQVRSVQEPRETPSVSHICPPHLRGP